MWCGAERKKEDNQTPRVSFGAPDPAPFLATSTVLFSCLGQYVLIHLFISICINFCLGQPELGLVSFEIRRGLTETQLCTRCGVCTTA